MRNTGNGWRRVVEPLLRLRDLRVYLVDFKGSRFVTGKQTNALISQLSELVFGGLQGGVVGNRRRRVYKVRLALAVGLQGVQPGGG